MAVVRGLKADVTPLVDKVELQAQVDEQVAVLYSQEASMEQKEIAALNFERLVTYYATLFNQLPAGAEYRKG